MGCAISLLIGFPMYLGKGILRVDMTRLTIHISKWTLSMVRRITDPVVDIILEIIKDVIVFPGLTSLRAATRIIGDRFFGGLSTTTSGVAIDNQASLSYELPVSLHTLLDRVLDGLALVGGTARRIHDSAQAVLMEVAFSDTAGNRVICALVGYSTALSFVVLFAVLGETGVLKFTAGLWDAIKEYSMLGKVGFHLDRVHYADTDGR